VGSSWDQLLETLKASQRIVALVAAGIAVLAVVAWLALRRRDPA
jgi:hypothetical protein